MEIADIRAFARITDLNSISAAARTLGLPKSTISRSLTRLEAMVGSVLVERSTRHLRLTDAGVLFRPYAERILADVDEASTALESYGGVPRGRLRINAPFTFAVGLLAPMLPAFMARYPAVSVILDIENRIIDMPVEAADLVIRIGALPDMGLIARKLTPIEMWVCASPGYLAKYGKPTTIADLAEHRLIAGFDRVMTWTFFRTNGRTEAIEVQPHTVFPEPAALQIVLAGGAGIGRLPGFLAQQAIADGTLVRLFADFRSDVIDVHALYPSHRSLSAKVRVFIDALVAHLAQVQEQDQQSQGQKEMGLNG
jgi:DNA-binding transcriptional LysR family regulator